MSGKVDISATERGVYRLFAIDLDAEGINAFNNETYSGDGDWPLKAALGADFLDPDFIEVFPVSNLEGYGLVKYLVEGNDIPTDQVEPLRAQLENLTGHVLIVNSSAFGGAAQTLSPKSPLRHIATFSEAPIDMTPLPLDSDAAAPYSGAPSNTPPIAPKGRAGGSLVVVGLAVLAILILWWAFR
jgi:hypothetical protein